MDLNVNVLNFTGLSVTRKVQDVFSSSSYHFRPQNRIFTFSFSTIPFWHIVHVGNCVPRVEITKAGRLSPAHWKDDMESAQWLELLGPVHRCEEPVPV